MKTQLEEVRWAWDHPIVQDLLLKHYRPRLFSDPDQAAVDVERILSLAGAAAPARVLDVGCGLAYHAIEFAKRGYEVLAFDPGDRYQAIARDHIAQAEVSVELRQISIRQLTDRDRFHVAWAGALCIGQLTPEEAAGDLARICRAVVPGGWFVCTVAGWPKDVSSGKTRNWGELEDCFVLTEKWRDEEYYHENCWFVYPDRNEVIKVIEDERMYGVEEIVPILVQAGFVEINTYSDLSATAPATGGEHFAFVCRTPET